MSCNHFNALYFDPKTTHSATHTDTNARNLIQFKLSISIRDVREIFSTKIFLKHDSGYPLFYDVARNYSLHLKFQGLGTSWRFFLNTMVRRSNQCE